MNYFLKYLTQLSWPAAIVLSVASMALWIPDFLAEDAPIGLLSATLSLTVVNAVVLMVLFYHCGVTRYRVGMPVLLYMLLMAAFPSTHTDWQTQVAILFIAPVVLLLHNVHLNPETQEQSFVATLLICVASLFAPSMVWLVPCLWLGFVLQQAFSLRSMLASLMAVAVFAIYFGITVFVASRWGYELLVAMPDLSMGWWGHIMPLADRIRLYVLLAVSIGFSVVLLLYIDRASTRVRTFTLVYMILLVVTMLVVLFGSHTPTINPLPVYAASVLATLFFQQRESVVQGIIFLCFMLIAVLSVFL